VYGMTSNPRLDRFISRLALASAKGPVYEGDEAGIKRIVVLDPPVSNVVGRLQALGSDCGEFCVSQGGVVRFRHARQDSPWFYVNRGVSEFQAAAHLFNAFSWSAYDPDDPECEYFEDLASRFRAALEKIEPLGDPAASLWSATVHNTEMGLWALY